MVTFFFLPAWFADVVVLMGQNSLGNCVAAIVAANHPVIPGHRDTDDLTIVAQALATKLSIILSIVEAANNNTGLQYYMVGEVSQVNRILLESGLPLLLFSSFFV